jgi:hypothetical protein
MVTAFGLQALPALAQRPVATTKVASTTDDLPLTPQFAALLSKYRDCVLHQVDQAALGDQRMMAQDAMSACALSRGEVQAQLLSDIRSQKPAAPQMIAMRSAETGMDQVDPMVEESAIDWAHVRYARSMF